MPFSEISAPVILNAVYILLRNVFSTSLLKHNETFLLEKFMILFPFSIESGFGIIVVLVFIVGIINQVLK